MVYPALLPLMRTPRLPVVDWTDAHRRFKWTPPFRRKTKSVFCACVITFQMQSNKCAWGGSFAGRSCYLSGRDFHLYVTPCNWNYLKWFYKKNIYIYIYIYIYRWITQASGPQTMTLNHSDLPVSILTPYSQEISRHKRCDGDRRRDPSFKI